MDTFDLLIIFTDTTRKVVHDVNTYEWLGDRIGFMFEKNGYRGFVPAENVRYFGRKVDWEGETNAKI